MMRPLKWFVVCDGMRKEISNFEETFVMNVRQQSSRFELSGIPFTLVLNWKKKTPSRDSCESCQVCLSHRGDHVVAGFTVPAMEARRYGYCSWRDFPRSGYRLEPQEALGFELEMETFPCASIPELFNRLNHEYRGVRGYGRTASCELGSDAAAALVDPIRTGWKPVSKRFPIYKRYILCI